MHSVSTFYVLYAEISSWEYCASLSEPGESAEGSEPGINIEAVNKDCDILQNDLPLWISIIDNKTSSDSAILLPPWELGLISPMDEGVPIHLQADITVPRETISDMKDSLFLIAKSAGSTMQILLTVQEKESSPDSIAERTFSIIDFGYKLIHRRDEV